MKTPLTCELYMRAAAASPLSELVVLLLGLGAQRDRARRRRDPGLRRILAREDDVSVAHFVHAPVDLVVGAVRAADVRRLGRPTQSPRLITQPLPAGSATIARGYSPPVTIATSFSSSSENCGRMTSRSSARGRPASPPDRAASHVGAERIPVAVALGEVVLGELHTRKRRRCRRGRARVRHGRSRRSGVSTRWSRPE